MEYVYLFEESPGYFVPKVGRHPESCKVIGACVDGEWRSIEQLTKARKNRDQEAIIERMCSEAVEAPLISGMDRFIDNFGKVFGV